MVDIPHSNEVYCFLDTDILLHFTDFDQVDWRTFLNAKQVYLVLPITIIYELNKHKDDGSKPGLQQRARYLLPKIAKLVLGNNEPVHIKEDVFLIALRKEPRIKWSALELDENVQDDRILAKILLFKEDHPDRDVRFLTNDYAAMLKADDRDVPILIPDGIILTQKTLKSTVEAELEATRRELGEYKNRGPKLEFGFDDGQKIVSNMVYHSSEYNMEYAKILVQVLDDQYIPKQVVSQRANCEDIIKAAKGSVSETSIKEFSDEYEEYMGKLEPALKQKFMSKYGRRCKLSFVIKNSGTAPMTDLIVELTFPLGTLVIDADDEGKETEIPKEPKASWIAEPASAFGKWGLGTGINVPYVIRHDPTWDLIRLVRKSQAAYEGPLCNSTIESHVVSYRAKKLRHGDTWFMPPVVAYFIQEKNNGFPIGYEIYSDQGLKKIAGTVSVQWKLIADSL